MRKTIRIGSRGVDIDYSIIDRAIGWVSPASESKRLKAKVLNSLALSGGYSGGSRVKRSLSDFNPKTLDADSALVDDLPVMRERSSDLIRNAPLAGGVINTAVTSVVGPGLRLKSSIDYDYLGISKDEAVATGRKLERMWNFYASSPDCDITRTQDFYQLQDLTFRAVLESGDVFTYLPRFRSSPAFPFGLRLQTIEAHRVSNKDDEPDTETLVAGVQKDQFGAPVAYHVLRQHPGNLNAGFTQEWDVVRAYGSRSGRRNMLAHYKRLRPGQTRGVPYLAPVIESFKQLQRYTDAELMAAVIAGMFTVFVKTESGDELDLFEPSGETGGNVSDPDYKLGNGAVVNLGYGDDISIANPGRPNAMFDPFVMSVLRQIGVCLEIPFEILIKHFTASYSAARGAVMEAWRFFLTRREWLGSSFCQPIYETLVDELAASGQITLPGYFSDPLVRQAYLGSTWVGRPQGQIDPLKEMNANVIAESHGWKTAEEITKELTGGDWEAKSVQRSRENKIMIDSGLKVDPTVMEDGKEDNPEPKEDGGEE